MLIPLAVAMSVTKKKKAVRHQPVRELEEGPQEPEKRRAAEHKHPRPPRTVVRIANRPKKNGDEPEWEEVMGYVIHPALAVTPHGKSSGWDITHIPTGYRMSVYRHYRTVGGAINAIHRLLEIPVKWEKLSTDSEKNRKIVGEKKIEAIKQIMSEAE